MMKTNTPPRSWWREPMVWLVIGGPLSVVVASLITAVIAWRGADPVVTEPTGAARAQALQPAVKVRNHSTSSQ
jgi:uncharacterized protein